MQYVKISVKIHSKSRFTLCDIQQSESKWLAIGLLVGSVLLTATWVAVTIGSAFFAPGMLSIFLPSMGAVFIAIPIGLNIGAAALVGNEFTWRSRLEKKRDAEIQEVRENHPKLRSYFVENYREIKGKIEASIRKDNEEITALDHVLKMSDKFSGTETDKDARSLKVRSHEKALEELAALHAFYSSEDKI